MRGCSAIFARNGMGYWKWDGIDELEMDIELLKCMYDLYIALGKASLYRPYRRYRVWETDKEELKKGKSTRIRRSRNRSCRRNQVKSKLYVYKWNGKITHTHHSIPNSLRFDQTRSIHVINKFSVRCTRTSPCHFGLRQKRGSK